MSTRPFLFGTFVVLLGLGPFVLPLGASAEAQSGAAPVQILTLQEALQRTLAANPDLAAAGAEQQAAAAERRQAGRRPNPELGVSLENALGSGAYQGSDGAELTLELSLPVELGGKRRLRREAADLALELAATAQASARIEALTTTRQRYLAVLAAQEQLQLAQEEVAAANRSLQAAEERISTGKAPRVDRLRLQGEASIAALERTRAERALELARQALAAAWGATAVDFERLAGELTPLPDLPELATVEGLLEQTPAAARARLASARSRNQLAQTRAERIPDPSLTLGWRHFQESDDQALVFGVALPLPLFNSGRDAVAAAGSRLQGELARAQSARNQARQELRSAWQGLADARAAAELFAQQIVPAAAESFAAADFGYRAGKFNLIELLDAQRTLFEARRRQLEAVYTCQLAASELQRLLGADPAATINPSPVQ
ncbi:TolC family protein [Desulfuromonas carbonis]